MKKHKYRVQEYRAEYHALWNAVARCTNPRNASYSAYGAKGVQVCEAWRGSEGFNVFIHDMGPRPSVLHSLDRVDVTGGYTRDNCRWATRSEQANNTRNTRKITLFETTKTFKQWAAVYGLRDSLVHTRINKLGWPIERAFTTPAAKVDQAKGADPAAAALRRAIQRCHNPNNPQYARYGARGIVVCTQWRGKRGLSQFKQDIGPHPGPGYSLDRIDTNQGYAPENCRWATRTTQLNNRRCTKTLTYAGRCLTYAQWARDLGIDEQTVRWRIKQGWPLPRVLAPSPIQRARRLLTAAAATQ